MKKKVRLKTIGWKEKVDFPDFGIIDIDAKIDTGAKTSVIHCSRMEIFKKYRKNYVKFVLLDESFPQFENREFVLPYHGERKVKSSFGIEENRHIILTRIRVFNKTYEIEISLRDRSNLEFPVLIGRSAIRKKFLVDVSKSNLSYKSKNKKNTKSENSNSVKKSKSILHPQAGGSGAGEGS